MFDFDKKPHDGCETCTTQEATVCLPVTVAPFAAPGMPIVECHGEPVVKQNECFCRGKVGAVCHFTISQKIKIEIPVDFGAKVKIGDAFVDCGCAKSEDGDCGCDRHERDY